MFERMKKERQLAEALEKEAMESRPAFNESLHRRIMSAAKQRHAVAARGVARRWQGIAAVAAAACLFVAAIGWQLIHRSEQDISGQGAEVTINDLPSIDELADKTVGRLDEWSVTSALEPQATHLKRDASAVASVFLDRLPLGMMTEEEKQP